MNRRNFWTVFEPPSAVRDPKWKHDRVTMLPRVMTAELSEQLIRASLVHQSDLAAGFGRVWLPDAIAGIFSERFARLALASGLSRHEPMEERSG